MRTGLFIQALNEMIDSFGRRDAGLNRHVPEVVLFLLFGVFLIAAAIVGFASGTGGHRPPAVSLVMVGLIVVLVFVILDLDRPRRGLIEVSKKSLYDLQASINPPVGRPDRAVACGQRGRARRAAPVAERRTGVLSSEAEAVAPLARCDFADRVRIARSAMSFEHSPKKAAAWMSGWLTAMVVMVVAGREATESLHVFQIMEMRSLLGLVLLYPLIHAGGGFAALRTGRAGLHVARNTFHYAAQFGWFLALTMIPIAQVVAIEFTMPIWTALLAVSFLGERLKAARIVAIVLGLIGVATIVRPDTGHLDPGQLVALAAAVGFAISVIMVKSLTRSESAVAIIFWMLVVQSAIGLVPARDRLAPADPGVLPWVLVIAVCGTYSHYCMTRALQHAERRRSCRWTSCACR